MIWAYCGLMRDRWGVDQESVGTGYLALSSARPALFCTLAPWPPWGSTGSFATTENIPPARHVKIYAHIRLTVRVQT